MSDDNKNLLKKMIQKIISDDGCSIRSHKMRNLLNQYIHLNDMLDETMQNIMLELDNV